MNYLSKHTLVIGGKADKTPQSEPIPFAGQSRNNAGGYAWEVDDWTRLRRWLILGSESGTYYATERRLTVENAEVVKRCLEIDGQRTVNEIVTISHEGRAPKNDQALFALAMCASYGSDETKTLALTELPKVARIGTHLFHFVAYVDKMRGWGPRLKKAIQNWYMSKSLDHVVNQVIKYRQRDGWSHRDLLRLSHPKVEGSLNSLFRWIVKGELGEATEGLDTIKTFMQLQSCTDANQAAELIRKYRLPRECVPTELLNDKAVWGALLDDMPLTAMIRNLGVMTKNGMFDEKQALEHVCSSINDGENIRRSRVHPIAVLAALTTYAQGQGVRGSNTWSPKVPISEALESAFYLAFENVEVTNERIMVALDVSGSMDWGTVSGVPGLTPRLGSAAMSMIHRRTNKTTHYVAFSHELIPIEILEDATILQVVNAISSIPMGGTDCSLPMLYAMQNDMLIDLFVIYTDNETWCGNIHPAQALRQYREKTGIDAKLAVVAMTADRFSIADPKDRGMLDVVGFDTATPAIISQFMLGNL